VRALVVTGIGAITILFAVGCDIPESERCGSGARFYWDPETQKCLLSDTGSSDTETETLDSGTENSTASDDWPSGLGEPCWELADCEGFEANRCTAQPIRPEGYCTIGDCEQGKCPGTYQCCDCTSAGMSISCVNEDDAPLAEEYMSCTCS
jgi:hypothetical protein